MTVNKVKIVSCGSGRYSSSISATSINSDNKHMSPKEIFTKLTSNIKANYEYKESEKR